MSLLANLTSDDSIANEKDSIGGGGVLDTNLYNTTISLAFLTKSDGGALALNLRLKTEDGKEIRSQQWMTSGNDKGNKNYFVDRNGDKQYLPGFNIANSVALLAVGKEISQLDTEKKVINLYNKDAKAEVPTQVDMVTELLNKPITVALIKQTVDKTQKNDAGEYVPTGETREENEIDKIFRTSDMKTTAEIRAQAEEATFYKTWSEKWVGKVKDKTSKDKKNTGTAGAPKAAGAAAAGTKKPTNSLFAN